ncbi:MAG TPA: DUF2269 family protein [Symbiobacteriaceae bacterium]
MGQGLRSNITGGFGHGNGLLYSDTGRASALNKIAITAQHARKTGLLTWGCVFQQRSHPSPIYLTKGMNAMNRITITPRKWLLSAHILFTTGVLGYMICALVLGLLAANAKDVSAFGAAYAMMKSLDLLLHRTAGIAMIVTGVLLAALTHWGLFRSPWIIVKEVVTLGAIAVGVIWVNPALDKVIAIVSAEGLNALHNPAYVAARTVLLGGILLQLVALSLLVIISVFKPWGLRNRPKSTVKSS